ncbi:PTS system, glucitol/sorbitol-specific IIA component [Salinibacillus kushneri]|uniref:PTS system, glucitol/sorbitol-specific IIA component n=1 Tax=Salinibacillus kushneri TaxID=237682 RepID=A0A1H9ZDQ3_9BACI|nr:PTS glucitol/sorbitol transporter subunit IIA [Salinibacillus kushneri]SES79459.1 PTS system, glucitol/sorbitol-specific IIA component [Salinibacillus kushneri]
MYKSTIKEIGALVPSFEEEKVVILFGPQAPDELREMSVIHEIEETSDQPIQEGGTLRIGDQTYTITAVGSAANDNLKELGHISVYFKEPADNVLPGAVFVSPSQFPTFNEGNTIVFET